MIEDKEKKLNPKEKERKKTEETADADKETKTEEMANNQEQYKFEQINEKKKQETDLEEQKIEETGDNTLKSTSKTEQVPYREVKIEANTKEQGGENHQGSNHENALGVKKKPKVIIKRQITDIPQIKDETLLKLEKIMQEGLEDIYKDLPPLKKQQFKIKGEKTAWEIRHNLKSTRVKIKKIFKLIFEWLKLLPGVNKFFLEQEAKIKTDKIIALKDQQKKEY